MKKIIFILIFIFCFVSPSNAASIVYRLSSGEVVTLDDPPIGYPPSYFGFVTDPTAPDGLEIYDSENNKRVLGYAKIYSGGVVRNATQEEIDTFLPAAQDDKNSKYAAAALAYFQNNAKFRMAIMAVIKGVVKEDNEQRLWIRTFMEAVAASTSLADFQSRVAALDTPADREFQDAKDYIINQVSKDD